MSCISKLEEYLVHPFGQNYRELEIACQHLEDIHHGQFLNVINSSMSEEVFGHVSDNAAEATFAEALEHSVTLYADKKCNSIEKQLDLLCIGIACLQGFVQSNWTGPTLTEDSFAVKCLRSHFSNIADAMRECVDKCLTLDGESCWLVKNQELLLMARVVLKICSDKFDSLPSCKWWLVRCLYAHQQILDEHSALLHDSLVGIVAEVGRCEWLLGVGRHAAALFHLEAARVMTHYGRVVQALGHVQAAQEVAGMTVNIVGALGKRTHFQQKDVAQLRLRVSIQPAEPPAAAAAAWPPPSPEDYLPRDISLDDEIRLNRVKFVDPADDEFPALQPIHQAVLLGFYVHTQKSQPKDKLADEEIMPYLTCVLSQPQTWSMQVAALLMRCHLESNHRRTVERSMQQAQSLVDGATSADGAALHERLAYVYCSYLPHRWAVEAQLANMLVALGAFNSALDIYLRLELWDEVIVCYNLLKLRHKAAEVIRQELQKKYSVKLWCLLGDATDDPGCYEKAWELSERRSGRAQRHWGVYHFNRKQFAEAIPHLKTSVSLNSMQQTVWFMLGFAAMEVEDWPVCAAAYRRYCNIDSESFEAWNNLAKAYVKLGEKARAWKTLQEAIKCNYENWQVWDNLMAVSTDCGEFDEVIRSYHRLLDLKGKHVDEEVLKILVTAVVESLPDNSGSPANKYRKSALGLFGRLTGKVTTNATLWQLYAQLTASVVNQNAETLERTAQFLQRAHRAAVQNARWDKEVGTCADVMRLCVSLADAYLECCKRCTSPAQARKLLTSAKFSLQGVLTRVKKEHFDVTIDGGDPDLAARLEELEKKLVEILEEIAGLPPAENAIANS